MKHFSFLCNFLQTRFNFVRPAPTDVELKNEAEWIFLKAFVLIEEFAQKRAIILRKIYSLLEMIRLSNFEIPFIATYRKDYFK
jgi:hypothetical protein